MEDWRKLGTPNSESRVPPEPGRILSGMVQRENVKKPLDDVRTIRDANGRVTGYGDAASGNSPMRQTGSAPAMLGVKQPDAPYKPLTPEAGRVPQAQTLVPPLQQSAQAQPPVPPFRQNTFNPLQGTTEQQVAFNPPTAPTSPLTVGEQFKKDLPGILGSDSIRLANEDAATSPLNPKANTVKGSTPGQITTAWKLAQRGMLREGLENPVAQDALNDATYSAPKPKYSELADAMPDLNNMPKGDYGSLINNGANAQDRILTQTLKNAGGTGQPDMYKNWDESGHVTYSDKSLGANVGVKDLDAPGGTGGGLSIIHRTPEELAQLDKQYQDVQQFLALQRAKGDPAAAQVATAQEQSRSYLATEKERQRGALEVAKQGQALNPLEQEQLSAVQRQAKREQAQEATAKVSDLAAQMPEKLRAAYLDRVRSDPVMSDPAATDEARRVVAKDIMEQMQPLWGAKATDRRGGLTQEDLKGARYIDYASDGVWEYLTKPSREFTNVRAKSASGREFTVPIAAQPQYIQDDIIQQLSQSSQRPNYDNMLDVIRATYSFDIPWLKDYLEGNYLDNAKK